MSGSGRAESAGRRRAWMAGAGVAALLLVAYLPALRAGFVWDDDSYVTENWILRDPGGFWRAWIPRTTPQYYPLVFTGFWLEYRLFGLDAFGYHLVNVLLHGLAAVLAWRVLARLRVPGAWLAAALFALHPLHVESVAWITERKNVLSGVLYLAAALGWLAFDERRVRGERRAAAWCYGLALAAFVGALLSKTVTCSLPAALLLAHLWRRERLEPRRWLPLVPFAAVGLLLALQTAYLERTHVGAFGAAFERGALDRVLVAARALVFYPWKLLVPWPLVFIHPRWELDPTAVASWLAPVVVVAAGAAAALAWRRGRRGPALCLAFYTGTILPALGFVDVYPHRFSFVAEHFAYLASLGVLVALSAATVRVVRSPRTLTLVAGAWLGVLAFVTHGHAHAFHDLRTLWADTLTKNPGAWMAHNNLALLDLEEAHAARAAGLGERAASLATDAVEHARAALALSPDHHGAAANLAEGLELLGRRAEALEAVGRAVDLAPEVPHHHWQRGRLLEASGDDAGARAEYERALELAPPPAWTPSAPTRETAKFRVELPLDLGRVLARHGELGRAIELHRAALRVDPGSFAARGMLATLYERAGDCAAARAEYGRLFAGERRPEALRLAREHYVRFLLDCGSPGDAERAEALRVAQELVASGGRDAGALELQALALAALGRREEARESAREALTRARRDGNAALVQRLRAWLGER